MANKRLIIDVISAGMIRVASVMILLVILGLFAQIAFTALPLFESPSSSVDVLPATRAGPAAELKVTQDSSANDAGSLPGLIDDHRPALSKIDPAAVPEPKRGSWLDARDTTIEQVHLKAENDGLVPSVLTRYFIPAGIQAMSNISLSRHFVVLDRAGVIHVYRLGRSQARTTFTEEFEVSDINRVDWLDESTFALYSHEEQRLVRSVKALTNTLPLGDLFSFRQYEGYPQPTLTWQPRVVDGAESKYSLVPLLWGTMSAALFSLMLALPVAMGAAIYVGYYMPPVFREAIKPMIEMIAAFPGVVIAGIAMLWLAPRLHHALAECIGIVLTVPIIVALSGLFLNQYFQTQPGRYFSKRLPMVVLLVLVIAIYTGAKLGESVEGLFFEDSVVLWFERYYGLSVSYFNGVLVGIALGIAVFPTIFSLAEEAIFSTPKGAATGSLALGASPWQSFIDGVLPVAAPGIVAAIMLGLSRAIGETMILLLLSGNTPIQSSNPLEGMRSVAATLAIELPEAGVDSTHYRVLFFSALALFALTFLINTCAQLLKRRWRRRYGVVA